MKLKKFTAATVREALIQVKEEMGENAVILRTEKVKSGALGGVNQFEVTAAIDETIMAEEDTPKALEAPARSPSSAYGAQKDVTNLDTPLGRIIQGAPAKKPEPIAEVEKQVVEKKEANDEVGNNKLSDQISALREELQHIKGSLQHNEDIDKYPDEFMALAGRLQNLGISSSLIQDLVAELIINCPTDKRDMKNLLLKLEDVLSKKIPCKTFSLQDSKAKVLLFIGPTGVGKSTTIAKLAAGEVLGNHKDVAIVSTDAYRMGAIEQMDLFSKAAEIDFEAIFDIQDIDKVLARFSSKDLILVDTAGRAKNHFQHMEELQALKNVLLPDEVHLVVSANTRDRDLEEIFHRFQNVGITQIAITKVDETLEPGGMLNLPIKKGVPLSYLCNGQKIPDDLHLAEGSRLVQLLLQGTL